MADGVVAVAPIAGLALGILAIWAFLAGWPAREWRPYGLALIVASVVYVGLALAAGSGRGQEIGGLGLFTLLALAGLRWPCLLPAGWLLHGLWDLGLHAIGPTTIAPDWYPPACVAFDLVVASYAALRCRAWTRIRAAVVR